MGGKVRGLKWDSNDRKRGWFSSKVEDCNEELCTHEEMDEDYENSHWHGVSGKHSISDESYNKYKACVEEIQKLNLPSTRDTIRKQCLPYEWTKVGFPMDD